MVGHAIGGTNPSDRPRCRARCSQREVRRINSVHLLGEFYLEIDRGGIRHGAPNDRAGIHHRSGAVISGRDRCGCCIAIASQTLSHARSDVDRYQPLADRRDNCRVDVTGTQQARGETIDDIDVAKLDTGHVLAEGEGRHKGTVHNSRNAFDGNCWGGGRKESEFDVTVSAQWVWQLPEVSASTKRAPTGVAGAESVSGIWEELKMNSVVCHRCRACYCVPRIEFECFHISTTRDCPRHRNRLRLSWCDKAHAGHKRDDCGQQPLSCNCLKCLSRLSCRRQPAFESCPVHSAPL